MEFSAVHFEKQNLALNAKAFALYAKVTLAVKSSKILKMN